MHWDAFDKQDTFSTVEKDGGCRVGKVHAAQHYSPMPDHTGFKL